MLKEPSQRVGQYTIDESTETPLVNVHAQTSQSNCDQRTYFWHLDVVPFESQHNTNVQMIKDYD